MTILPNPGETNSRPAIQSTSERLASSAPLTWTAHPLIERPRPQVVALGALLFGVPTLVWFNFPHPVYPALAAAMLLVSTARFFFPTFYRLDGEAIHIRFLGIERQHHWTTFRRFEFHRHGAFLSPFPTPRRLDNYRGVYLLWGRASRSEAEALIREKMKKGQGQNGSGIRAV